MFSVVVIACILAELVSSSGVTIGISPYSQPVQSQYHAQDIYGQYVYGYSTPTSTKSETKTADGVTHGGYSYIDSFGILQTVQYSADPIHGFRVAATNLPQDLPDVAYAKAQHLANFEAIKLEREHQAAQAVGYSNPAVLPAVLPAPVQDLPEVIKARAEHLASVEATKARNAAIAAEHVASFSPVPVSGVVQLKVAQPSRGFPVAGYIQRTPVAYTPLIQRSPTSQYHAQDVLGQYSYGYIGPHSSKAETKTADGITRGGYSYIDANGIIQSVQYISDPVNGFRVAATNLPVGHVGNEVEPIQNQRIYTQNVIY